MLLTEQEKFQAKLGGYVSIGITNGGVPRGTISVPWVSTTQAFNMRTPDVYIAPEDLQNGALMALLDSCKVIGCYIWTPLEEYSFLTHFQELQDLTIYNAENIQNLDFVKELPQLRMLFLKKARLQDLNALVALKKERRSVFSTLRCVGLYECQVADLSAFAGEGISFSEFLIWNPKDRDERQRWQTVKALTHRYYELG